MPFLVFTFKKLGKSNKFTASLKRIHFTILLHVRGLTLLLVRNVKLNFVKNKKKRLNFVKNKGNLFLLTIDVFGLP